MLNLLSAKPSLPSRVVIMGAGGFVGRACSLKLQAESVPVRDLTRAEVDLLAAGAAANLAARLLPSDTLVVTSAVAPVKDSAMLLANLRMMEAVCAAVKQNPVRHLVYISSDAVYKDSSTPLTEASCAEPASLHGVMHLAREVMLQHELPQIPKLFVRPTLIYGANDPHSGYGPNRFARLARNGEPITLFGEGEERRDHIAIGDVAEIVARSVLHRATGVVNAATGEVISFREIAELTVQMSGSKSSITSTPRRAPMPHNGYRPFDVSLLRRRFPGLRPTPLTLGLQNMITK